MLKSSTLFIAIALLGIPTITPAAAAEACPNAARRAEQGTAGFALPDCRAYELVSPGSILTEQGRPARVSVDGNAITYQTPHPAVDAGSSGYYYLATRGSSSWTVQSVAPQNAPAALFEDECEQNVFFSPDLAKNIDEEGWFDQNEPGHCKRNQNVLVPGEPVPYRNVFLHDIATGSNQLVNLTPESVIPANAKFQDASDDFSHVVFSEEAQLTPEAPNGYNLYIWAGATVRLATYLPDGTPVAGELAEAAGHRANKGGSVGGSGLASSTGAVSADGRRIFFYADDSLYLRRNADQPQSAFSNGECAEPQLACTVQVDASVGPGTGSGGVFWRADSMGSRVFFTDESRLTNDATATMGKADLYEYDDASGRLTDLTANAGEAADVRGVGAAGDDGSYVYFVANGVLAAGASPGNCKGAEATGQKCNLYVVHKGTITFIASLSRFDQESWQEPPLPPSDPRVKQRNVAANVSPSGRFFVFTSIESLTGFDNRDISTESPNRELFLYEATASGGAGRLSCVSCIQNGTRPEFPVSVVFAGNYGPSTPGGNASWKTNVVLDDGSVFFETQDPLMSEDVNGLRDVYEYRGGQQSLISTGVFASDSFYMGASSNGSDVFFRTPQSLVGSDIDNQNVSLYDAHVNGGFVEPSPLAPPCEAVTCRSAAPAGFGEPPPASTIFRGPGNRQTHGARRCHLRTHRRHGRHHCGGGKHRSKGVRSGAVNTGRGAGR